MEDQKSQGNDIEIIMQQKEQSIFVDNAPRTPQRNVVRSHHHRLPSAPSTTTTTMNSPPRIQYNDTNTDLAETLQSLSVTTNNNDCSGMASNSILMSSESLNSIRNSSSNSYCPSPAHSHVSAGSFVTNVTSTPTPPPMIRFEHLTPIARNTSTTFLDTRSSKGGVPTMMSSGIPITPNSSHHEQELHGEHLTLPSADDEDDDQFDNNGGGSVLPPLKPLLSTAPQSMLAPGLPLWGNESPPLFPLRQRKCQSFETRDQYHASLNGLHQPLHHDDDDDELFQASDDDDDDSLQDIHKHLCARRQPYAPVDRPAFDTSMEFTSPDALDMIFKHDDAIPLQQVPSLRMSRQMAFGGSTTSMSCSGYTTGGDETDEDSLVFFQHGNCDNNCDNNSLQDSYGSMLSLCEDPQEDQPDADDVPHQQYPGATSFDILLPPPPPPPVTTTTTRRSRKRHHQEAAQAREWLAGIQGDSVAIAEAASSKFLLQNTTPTTIITTTPKATLRRQVSSPIT